MAFDTILMVGCGNMPGAMLDGWLAAGFAPERFSVADPAPREVPAGGPQARCDSRRRAIRCDPARVKPQLLAEVAPQVAPLAGPERVLSRSSPASSWRCCGGLSAAAACVRLMPNLSAALGKSPIALAAHGLDAGRRAQSALLAPLGTPEWVAEDAFDLVTALAGSGPAFVYRFIDALAQARAGSGCRDEGRRLALATVDGAAALRPRSPHDPAELARRVASPAGSPRPGSTRSTRRGAAPLIEQNLARRARPQRGDGRRGPRKG
jgi:pyrroline-5-carboxylate reductase